MSIKIDINPDDIAKSISEAIAKSAIGNALNEVIAKEVAKLSNSYGSPYEHVIQQFIKEEIKYYVVNNYKEAIQANIKAKLTEAYLEKISNKLWEIFEG